MKVVTSDVRFRWVNGGTSYKRTSSLLNCQLLNSSTLHNASPRILPLWPDQNYNRFRPATTDCRQTSGSAFATNAIVLQKDVTITGPIKTYESKAAIGNIVTRVFCGNCGSAISHKSAYFGDKQAVQTGNFADFAKIPFSAEIFIKDRWTGLAPIEGAAQVQANP